MAGGQGTYLPDLGLALGSGGAGGVHGSVWEYWHASRFVMCEVAVSVLTSRETGIGGEELESLRS